MIRVFLVDDHDLVRLGLRTYLGSIEDVEVVGEAAGVASALQEIAAAADLGRAPDIVLLDLMLTSEDGTDLLEPLAAAHPQVRVVVLTGFGRTARVEAALALGAAGCVLKDSDVDEIETAIRAVHAGGRHVDPRVGAGSGLEPLTPREHEVVRQVARGLSNKQIATRLDVSERTVQTHLTSIMRKLRLTSRTQVALWATGGR